MFAFAKDLLARATGFVVGWLIRGADGSRLSWARMPTGGWAMV